MNKTPEQEDEDAKDEVEYSEAELASLKEELGVGHASSFFQNRRKFVILRIARIEKQLPDIRERAGRARVNAEWLSKINHPKRT
jgi:hypothetical protein